MRVSFHEPEGTMVRAKTSRPNLHPSKVGVSLRRRAAALAVVLALPFARYWFWSVGWLR